MTKLICWKDLSLIYSQSGERDGSNLAAGCWLKPTFILPYMQLAFLPSDTIINFLPPPHSLVCAKNVQFSGSYLLMYEKLTTTKLTYTVLDSQNIEDSYIFMYIFLLLLCRNDTAIFLYISYRVNNTTCLQIFKFNLKYLIFMLRDFV